MKMKSILKEWRNFKLNEMSRTYTYSPVDIPEDIISRASSSQSNPKTDLAVKETIKELFDIVRDNNDIFISFVKNWNDSIPTLSVNPTVKYETPHGIYGYPLEKESLIRYFTQGQPTSAKFATNYPYIQVYKINEINTIKIKSNNETNYQEFNYNKDIKTLANLTINYISAYFYRTDEDVFDNNETINTSKTIYDLFRGSFAGYESSSGSFNLSERNIDTQGIYTCLSTFIKELCKNNFIEENGRVSDEIQNVFVKFVNNLASSTRNKYFSRSNVSSFYKIYFIAYFYSKFIDYVCREGGIDSGSMFSILLNSIGIKGIDDSEGTGTIHSNEPAQAVMINVDDSDRYTLLGTYNNINPNNENKEEIAVYIDELLQENKIEIDDIDVEFTKIKYGDINSFIAEGMPEALNEMDTDIMAPLNVKYDPTTRVEVYSKTLHCIYFKTEYIDELIYRIYHISISLNKAIYLKLKYTYTILHDNNPEAASDAKNQFISQTISKFIQQEFKSVIAEFDDPEVRKNLADDFSLICNKLNQKESLPFNENLTSFFNSNV